MKRVITGLILVGTLLTMGTFTATAAEASTNVAAAKPKPPNKCLQRNTYRNVATGYYLDANGGGGKGTKIITWYRNGRANQLWCMEKAKEGGWYFHPSYNLRLCMDSPDTQGKYDEILWTCKGNSNQRFNVSGGTIVLRRDGLYGYVTGQHDYVGQVVFNSRGPRDWGNQARWK